MSMSFICYSYYLIGIVALLSALVVASSLNPVLRIAFLILVFMTGSVMMILLDFYFLGLTYIIVYVGAIMILFLFVIMMVQIHLMTRTFAITPRIGMMDIDKNLPISETSGITYKIKESINNLELIPLTSELALSLSLQSDVNDGGCATYPFDGMNHLNYIPNSDREVQNDLSLNGTMLCIMMTPKEGLRHPQIRSLTLGRPNLFNILGVGIVIICLAFIPLKLLDTSGAATFLQSYPIVTYFHPLWSIDFLTMSDLETLGYILYVAYPTALIIISVALWVTMIGIIKVTIPDKS